jgi:DNA repair exonuclease SbcCD nuclease subunit
MISCRRWGWLLCLLAGVPACSDDTGSLPVYHPAVKLLVFSDPHYFDPSLGTSGAAFEAYLASDRKLIAESDAIIRAMVEQVAAEDPQVVLVSGDLTKDGEQLSHQTMAGYLAQMKAGGRKVFVVPGNHDIQNGGASSYSGDTVTPVSAISASDFADIYYKDFGFSDAIARDGNSLSYVAELVPGLWLLALDSCIYGDARGPMQSSGRFLDGTKAWIQAQLDEAKQRGVRVMAMMHHGLVEHFANQAFIFPEFVINDRDAVAGLLSNGGVGAIFTGHFHANDITRGTPSTATQSIYDVETGSAVTYPCPYRIVDVSDDSLAITTQHITSIDYDLGGAPDFQTYAHDSLRLGLETLISTLIEAPPYSVAPTDASQLAPWLGDGLVAHYAGDEVMPADALAEAQTLMSSSNGVMQLSGRMLQSIWTDLPPPDNTVTLDLAAR